MLNSIKKVINQFGKTSGFRSYCITFRSVCMLFLIWRFLSVFPTGRPEDTCVPPGCVAVLPLLVIYLIGRVEELRGLIGSRLESPPV